MTKFNIIQSEPIKYKKQICEFWQENLPGTPLDRIDWMQMNPAGPSIWFLAFDDKNRLIGTVSVMPRNLLMNGKLIRAGIVGDFMVDKKHRVFGPALDLQKYVIAKMAENKFDFIYTIPNPASISITQRVGYDKNIKLKRFVKPVHYRKYLRKYLNNAGATIAGSVLDILFRLFSKETFQPSRGVFQEVKTTDETFRCLLSKIIHQDDVLVGDFSVEYLSWKYLNNPEAQFSIITYRDSCESDLSGFIVFSRANEKINIFNIFALNKNIWNKLLGKIIKVAWKEKSQAIYIRLSEKSVLIKEVKKFLFFNAKDDIDLYAHGIEEQVLSMWDYSEGDRNI